MDIDRVSDILQQNYNLNAQHIQLFREGGNLAYAVTTEARSYFLKIVRPPFIANALSAVDIQLYLMKNRFPVIPIIPTKHGTAYVDAVETADNNDSRLFILYDYIAGDEPDPRNTEKVGELIGQFHQVMSQYPGKLAVKDKHFFIDRYVEIMRIKQYSMAEAFQEYGDELWERVKNLPRGYCHCDLYRGNIHQDSSGTLRITDFDTSCRAFPMYDVALFCNDTNWVSFEEEGYARTKARLEQFLRGYVKHRSLSKEEIQAVYDLIAVYHFQLQATMMEIHGYDCVGTSYFDKQYEWLIKWREQCRVMNKAGS